MKIATSCFECSQDQDSLGSPALIFAEFYDGDVLLARCPQGHEIRFTLEQNKFELLLEMGGLALLDGYFREAVSSFAVALERFFEFYLRVIAESRQRSESFPEAWKHLSKQSERQLGAFVVLYLLEEGTSPPLVQQMTEFRNEVVHKGNFPSSEKAYNYGRYVFDLIVRLGKDLKRKHPAAEQAVATQVMSEESLRIRSRDQSVGRTYVSMFLNWAGSDWSGLTFDLAMRALATRRSTTWARSSDPEPSGKG